MNKAAGWIAGLLVLLGGIPLALHFYVPPLANALELQIVFSAAPANPSEPLIVTGESGEGDFLFAKSAGSGAVSFGYDRWGAGGLITPPVAVQSGRRYSLRVESPSLAETRDSVARGPDRLRVWFDGQLVLETTTSNARRRGSRAHFGENPIGGSSCSAHFSGQLFGSDGRSIQGKARDSLTFRQRLSGWLIYGWWQLIAIGSLSFATGWCVARFDRLRRLDWSALQERYRWGPHRWFISVAAPCVLAFTWFVTNGSGQFWVRESFANFYDHQASSLLNGRLDVPREVIGDEAFVVAGKYYGYFGVTPALLRLPFVIFDLKFGELSRSFMLVDFLACLGASYALLRLGTRILRGPGAMPSPWTVAILTLATGLGSTLLFLGSRAYIYHEAILCGAAFGLWSAYGALRWLHEPTSRWSFGALACGVLAMHARPPAGLFALGLLGAVALAHLLRGAVTTARRPIAIGVACVLGVMSFSGLSYLKFGTFDGSPLRYSVQYTPKRLAKFEGKNFHLVNVANNFATYVWRPRVDFESSFPYLLFERRPNATHPEKKMDLEEPTAAFPIAMPALFVLAVAGSAWAGWRLPSLRRALAVCWLAVVPMAGALFAAIVTSHRYTADFCPFLIATSALALAGIDHAAGAARRVILSVASLLTLCSIVATVALSLQFQGELVWGVPDHVKKTYQQMKSHADALFGPAVR